jgi:peroxiredoxin
MRNGVDPFCALRKGGASMVSFGRASVASATQTLKVGDTAPDFELPGHRDNEKFRLSDYKGKKNVRSGLLPARLDTGLNGANAVVRGRDGRLRTV